MSDDYALYFDGIDDYVEIPAHSDLNVLDTTITFWFKTDKGTSVFLIRSGPDPAGPTYAVYLTTPGRLIWTYFDGTNDLWVQTPYPLINNRWYFCQAQLDTERKIIRVRINQRSWISASFATINRVPDLAPLRFGLTPFIPPPDWISMPLRGTMDEIKIYNRVLKDYELDWWYNAGQGRYGYPAEFGLVAGYHLDDPVRSKTPEAPATPLAGTSNGANNSGVTVSDYSGHDHSGTISGALWTQGYVRKGVINMSIVSHVILSVSLPANAPEEMAEEWAKQLKDKSERMKAGIDARLPDDVHFQSGLAEPAHKKFREFVKPTFVSRAGVSGQGIINGHLANLGRSFQKYRDGVEAAFANGAEWFKARVDSAKAHFKEGVAARTLLFTGIKRGERGPAPIAALWLTGDPITLRLMRAGDTIIEGGPYLICPESKKPGLKAMLNQRLIQAGVEIIKSGFDAAVITAQNQLTCEQVQGVVDATLGLIPFVAGGDSRVDYIVVDGNLYLEIKVSKM